ncbi:hypothetical protein EYF80_033359 [Liparis tanakae]|uniref:Uncharacterized protein n=1 Tax=Liparis tanakae TaxID=230148 RepID=A0A4Z2GSN2_9TELE|nr:hypothetical protein EYF80_033359 [Liparis tanakae]
MEPDSQLVSQESEYRKALHGYEVRALHSYKVKVLHNYKVTKLHSYEVIKLHSYEWVSFKDLSRLGKVQENTWQNKSEAQKPTGSVSVC